MESLIAFGIGVCASLSVGFFLLWVRERARP